MIGAEYKWIFDESRDARTSYSNATITVSLSDYTDYDCVSVRGLRRIGENSWHYVVYTDGLRRR